MTYCRRKKWETWYSGNHWELSWLALLGPRQISALVLKCQQCEMSSPGVQSPFPAHLCWRVADAASGKGGPICGKTDAVPVSVDHGRAWRKQEYGVIARSLTCVSTIACWAKLSSFLFRWRF